MSEQNTGDVRIEPYDSPAGGWGSARSLVEILTREGVPVTGSAMLLKQNKPDGFMCVSCAWAKPAKPLAFEYCENGAKATAWEQTRRRATPDFFAAHTVTECSAGATTRWRSRPPDASDALRSRDRPVPAGLLG